jgi:Uma2 family endonuclease
VYNSDARVRLSATRYVYPDLSISCAERDRGHTDVLTAPCVVVEVLLPSTEEYDRGAKFAFYRECPSVREYVLVAADRRAIEVYRRGDEPDSAAWTLHPYGPEDEVELTSVHARFPLAAVYADVEVL